MRATGRWWGKARASIGRVARFVRPSWPVALGLALGAAAIVWRVPIEAGILRHGPQLYQSVRPLLAHPERLVEPGPLSAAHRGVARLADCAACHEPTGVPDAGCLTCHGEIAERQGRGIGHHGRDLVGSCRGCHREHRNEPLVELDTQALNHQRAAFALHGRHATVACGRCHGARNSAGSGPRYLGLAWGRCVDCHADPHVARASRDAQASCERCHRESGWTGRHLVFEHARDTRFVLSGRHARVRCVECHMPPVGQRLAQAQLAELPTACVACHADPHGGQFPADGCAKCHTPAGWIGRDLVFDHQRDTPFALGGAHARVACAACHVPPAGGRLGNAPMAGLATGCTACHADPHAGQFAAERCSDCHTTAGWTGRDLVFEHRRDTRFVLDGGHGRLDCVSCHAPQPGERLASARLSGVGMTCASCHADPHSAQFGAADCASCHTSSGWKGAHLAFDHQRSRFPLDALHRDKACASCHGQGRYRTTPTDCAGCHAEATAELDGTALAGTAPSPHHGKVACAGCHLPDVARPQPADHAARCAGCHNSHYGALYFARSALVEELAGRALAGLVDVEPARARAVTDAIRGARRLGGHNQEGAAQALRRVLAETGR